MSLVREGRIGKKYAIYLPKDIVEALGFREGDRVILRVSDNSLIIEKVYDPLDLAISGEKFASVTLNEVEAISLEEQEKYLKGST
ncbi:AbrB/MazE/SpoVT family DNA-binding domain-containing protein [Candidatus Geothermarchaeota archaeon]|nr:MAG: AbrB/MazE/SpoVT family DNA-binding domain-containing protein [Candidatus Geothermarchaeota archaeon]RLG62765.1 MAG: AbrB/MazE/SpoVT family DNA-binding domain-containing protein [Candidatus Geothermarchaeota archaeon]HEW93822.1 AbrB/MazE/SpoVT family DNA-binding domain-containing protein [Thermoprotei archaeon]